LNYTPISQNFPFSFITNPLNLLPKSILPPGARIAAPALPLVGTDAVDVEVASGGRGGGVGGVDTGVAGGLGFGDADLWAFGTGLSGLGGTTMEGCFGGGFTLLCFLFCFSAWL